MHPIGKREMQLVRGFVFVSIMELVLTGESSRTQWITYRFNDQAFFLINLREEILSSA